MLMNSPPKKALSPEVLLAAAIRESGGKVHELSVTDALESDMEDVMLRDSIR